MDYSIIQPYLIKFAWMAGAIGVDLVGGMLVAWLVDKNFEWEKVPSFLQKYVPQIFGWLVFIFFSAMPEETSESIQSGLGATESVVYIAIMSGIGASILGHLAKFGVAPTTLAKFGIGKKDVG